MSNVAWIVGAGLSRSLGGPLLDDLLSVARRERMEACFPADSYKKLYELPAPEVRSKYWAFGPLASPEKRKWSDAEQFLEFLDRAAATHDDEQPVRRMLVRLFGSDASRQPQRYSWAARRLVAAECHEFLVDADEKADERWAPYRRWVEELGEQHTVISFNYDLVIEKASEAAGRPVHLALPGQPMPDNGPVLLKLHGSVDWQRKAGTESMFTRPGTANASYARVSVRYMLGQADHEELVIASPGPTKFQLANGALSTLWNEAVDKIKQADAIVFVGYRFPPSDSAARRILLDAISENRAEHLTLHTVLGPSVDDESTGRLAGLLEWALRRRSVAIRAEAARRGIHYATTFNPGRIVTHPLLAQDFFDVFLPESLTAA